MFLCLSDFEQVNSCCEMFKKFFASSMNLKISISLIMHHLYNCSTEIIPSKCFKSSRLEVLRAPVTESPAETFSSEFCKIFENTLF